MIKNLATRELQYYRRRPTLRWMKRSTSQYSKQCTNSTFLRAQSLSDVAQSITTIHIFLSGIPGTTHGLHIRHNRRYFELEEGGKNLGQNPLCTIVKTSDRSRPGRADTKEKTRAAGPHDRSLFSGAASPASQPVPTAPAVSSLVVRSSLTTKFILQLRLGGERHGAGPVVQRQPWWCKPEERARYVIHLCDIA